MKRFSKNAGMTLVEVIVATALMGMVVAGAYSLINFARLYLEKSKQEYEFQFSTRYTLQKTTDVVRYSSAVFAIPADKFSADHLDEGWDYIGIEGDNGEEIVKYTYDDATSTHIRTVLVPAQQNVRYEFVFSRVNPDDQDSLLQFTIRSYPTGTSDERSESIPMVTITSEAQIQNSLQIIEVGAGGLESAGAIAFRSEERASTAVGHVAMVLDNSGSMAWSMSGSYYPSAGNSRLDILKGQACILIDGFSSQDNIDVKLVPFATSANRSTGYAFRNASTYRDALKTDINSFSANGGTNTGDGLRQAYYALLDNTSTSLGATTYNYLVILVDGVTTFASVNSNTDRSFYIGDDTVDEDRINYGGQIAGNGSDLDTQYGEPYVNLMGGYIKGLPNLRGVYVIGFSAVSSDLNSVGDIATACSSHDLPAAVYTADGTAALESVLRDIRQNIVSDLWFLQGPRLWDDVD